jgi:hypothetical protein
MKHRLEYQSAFISTALPLLGVTAFLELAGLEYSPLAKSYPD